jgi:hypothetical protein
MIAPAVATTIEAVLKPASYPKPSRLEKMKPPITAPTKGLVSSL